jgi:hypothetical protein
VIVANPLQVKAIAHAHVKTDKIDAGVLARQSRCRRRERRSSGRTLQPSRKNPAASRHRVRLPHTRWLDRRWRPQRPWPCPACVRSPRPCARAIQFDRRGQTDAGSAPETTAFCSSSRSVLNGPHYNTLLSPGCRPARCSNRRMHPIMKAAITADAMGRLRANPPWSTGLSRKSPIVAPRGRVKMNAAQNSSTRDTLVQ